MSAEQSIFPCRECSRLMTLVEFHSDVDGEIYIDESYRFCDNEDCDMYRIVLDYV